MYTGHIRQRKNNSGKPTYQLVLEGDRNPLTGKRNRKFESVKGTKKDAEIALNRRIYELNNGINPIKPSSMKLGEWLDKWLDTYLPNIAETTRAGYHERIETRLKPYFGKYPLNTFSTNTIQTWVNTLTQAQLSPKTVKNVFLNLKAALDKAVSLKMLLENPCNQVVLPTMVKYQASVYNEQEIKQLLNVAMGKDIYLLIVLEIALGLRRGEVAALQWEDVDFNNGNIHITKNRVIAGNKKVIKTPKSASGLRTITVGDNVLALLKDEYDKYKKDINKVGFVDSGYVIHKDNGEPYSPDSLTQKWVRFRHSNNLRDIRFHDLRHTCATAMIAKGVDNKTVQTRLGHSSIQTTMNIYAHCLPSMNKSAGDKLDVLFD